MRRRNRLGGYGYGAPIIRDAKVGEHHTKYPTLTAFVAAAKASPDWGDTSSGMYDEHCGGSYEHAEQLATLGWSDGARKASALMRKVADRAVQSTQAMALTDNVSWDVTGMAFDVGAYLSGEPECWLAMGEQPTRKAVSICVNVTTSYGVSPDTMMKRGIAVAALVLALQSKGYPVTVDVVQVLQKWDGDPKASTVRVIDANGSPLDTDRLVYAIAHPSVFRRLGRAAQGRANWDGHGVQSDSFPGEYDLKFGGAHLYQVDRWTDGGEAWVMEQFLEQTK